MKMILHPGMPKCASSAIQATLISNRMALADAGCYLLDRDFVVSGKEQRVQHGIPYGVLYDMIADPEKMHVLCEGAREKARVLGGDHGRLYLSSEVLSHVNEEEVYGFHQRLAGYFETQVIVVVRAPWWWGFSAWKQGPYRTGKSFSLYAQERLQRGTDFNTWRMHIENLKRIYGGVQVVCMGGARGVLDDFMRLAFGDSVDSSKFYLPKMVNPSLNPLVCEILGSQPELFKAELEDKRNTIERHKNVLIQKFEPKSALFRDVKTLAHVDMLDELFDRLGQPFVDMLVECGAMSPEWGLEFLAQQRQQLDAARQQAVRAEDGTLQAAYQDVVLEFFKQFMKERSSAASNPVAQSAPGKG